MDTLVSLRNEILAKATERVLTLAVIASVLCINASINSHPIFAEDLRIAKYDVQSIDINSITQKVLIEVSPEARKRNFDNLISEKYPNATINDVVDGVKHIKITKIYNGRPVRINLVEVDLRVAGNLELTPALSGMNSLSSKKTISKIAKAENALVAVNGTYFKPQTGVPLGTLMIDGKMYTGPVYDRVALGIFENGFDTARVQLDAKLIGSGKTIKVDNINQPRMLSTYVLVYTPEWGKKSPYAPKYGMSLRVADGKIEKTSANPLDIPENGYVISGPKKILEPLLNEKTVELDIKTQPEWKNVKHIISGGPYLVNHGEVYVDMTAQKLNAIGGRNPRTAVGYTSADSFILVTVDGREGSSIGMTLMELANFMKSIGCIDAINLDGGGSTVMYVNGEIVNQPKVKGGIPISNALVISKAP